MSIPFGPCEEMKLISLAVLVALACISCNIIEMLTHSRAITNREQKVAEDNLSACLPAQCGVFGFPCDEEGRIDLSWLDHCRAKCDPLSGIIKADCHRPRKEKTDDMIIAKGWGELTRELGTPRQPQVHKEGPQRGAGSTCT